MSWNSLQLLQLYKRKPITSINHIKYKQCFLGLLNPSDIRLSISRFYANISPIWIPLQKHLLRNGLLPAANHKTKPLRLPNNLPKWRPKQKFLHALPLQIPKHPRQPRHKHPTINYHKPFKVILKLMLYNYLLSYFHPIFLSKRK